MDWLRRVTAAGASVDPAKPLRRITLSRDEGRVHPGAAQAVLALQSTPAGDARRRTEVHEDSETRPLNVVEDPMERANMKDRRPDEPSSACSAEWSAWNGHAAGPETRRSFHERIQRRAAGRFTLGAEKKKPTAAPDIEVEGIHHARRERMTPLMFSASSPWFAAGMGLWRCCQIGRARTARISYDQQPGISRNG